MPGKALGVSLALPLIFQDEVKGILMVGRKNMCLKSWNLRGEAA